MGRERCGRLQGKEEEDPRGRWRQCSLGVRGGRRGRVRQHGTCLSLHKCLTRQRRWPGFFIRGCKRTRVCVDCVSTVCTERGAPRSPVGGWTRGWNRAVLLTTAVSGHRQEQVCVCVCVCTGTRGLRAPSSCCW